MIDGWIPVPFSFNRREPLKAAVGKERNTDKDVCYNPDPQEIAWLLVMLVRQQRNSVDSETSSNKEISD